MKDWWKGAVIYQIYPRSFCDTNGDGVGDLTGVIAKLPYVADLGVDGIWLSPFFTSPMLDFGYDVSDYTGVDPVFGTLADFDRLLGEAHRLGLKLIIDQVYSHTSDQHSWFKDSRKRLNGKDAWYVWADARPDGSPPNNWLSVFGGPAWSWDTNRRQYYLHNFLSAQPDLNFHEEEVQEAILDVARFWLDRGVDGFRLDVANYYRHDSQLRDNPPAQGGRRHRPYAFQEHRFNRSQPDNLAFIERLRKLLDGYDDRMAVAEVFSDHPAQRSIEYTEGKTRLHTAYSFGFLNSERLSVQLVRNLVEPWSGVDAWPSWSFSNHDVPRAVSRWGGESENGDFALLLNTLLVCLRGTAFLYQGEELGLPQADVPFEKLKDPEAIRFWPDNLGRDGSRTPIPWNASEPACGFSSTEPWLPIDKSHSQLAVERQQADPGSVLNRTRQALRERRRHQDFLDTNIEFIDAPEPCLAFVRGRLLCIFNLGADKIEAPNELAARVKEPLPFPLRFSKAGNALTLPGYGGVIARQG